MSKIVSRASLGLIRRLPGLLLALLLLAPTTLLAHEARPLYLQIDELDSAQAGGYSYRLKFNLPPSITADNRPFLTLPDSCKSQSLGLLVQLDCTGSLDGKTIGIDYPKYNPSVSALARIRYSSGESHQALLSPQDTQWQLPPRESASAIVGEYTALGIEHILIGWDHLLFLLCLVMISGSFKRTLITVSGFTLSHSLTLVLTTLGLVRLPIAPVEAVIALSILFLAAEIARGQRTSLAWRYPVAVSTLFGLVHGFGFASVLQEIGLPQTELATALLFFNLGVEIGQVIFVLAVTTVFYLLGNWAAPSLARLQQALLYGAGSLAAFWTLQRIAGF
ncbi:membrane protein [Marinobacterium nitratireducens]|uniref:Membrane protein n=1 Tax=Marinobacterium nitratireducens TaxID=518897 RepID=A0A917Z9J6_9GAMM|nr:HupE/UreJ family protein [Marinobacterium nitratireducens]GGO78956.1 membrane protein [Marinobacterium nitratireducens]